MLYKDGKNKINFHQEVCDTVFKSLVYHKIWMRNDEYECGIEKCRNCWEEVEINTRWDTQKGGKCKIEICLCKDNIDQYLKLLKDLNLKELRVKYRENKIKGYDKMSKRKLINMLESLPEEESKKLLKWTYTERYLFLHYEAQQETGRHIANLVVVFDFVGKEYKFDTKMSSANG